MAQAFVSQALLEQCRQALPTRPVKFFDPELIGFYLEVRPSGGASFGIRYYVHGSPRQMVLADAAQTSANEARAAAWEVCKLVRAGRDPAWERRRGTGNMSLLRFVDGHYLPHVKATKRSWKTDESILRNHLLPALGAVSLARITNADIRTLQHQFLAEGAAVGTVNRRLALLGAVFARAIDWGQLPDGANPVRKVPSLADQAVRESFLDAEQMQRLLAVLDSEANRSIAELCRLLLLTGARRGEIANARWEHVDLQRGLLRVPLSKSGRSRHVVLSSRAIECIRRLPREPGCPWLLPAPRTGRPLTGVFQAWDRIRRRAGLPHLRLHDLRHSYASFLVNAGRSLYEVQHLLGHTNPRTTQRYAHLAPGTLRDAADVVSNLVDSAAA